MRVYRVSLYAYNSRQLFDSCWLEYEVRAIDREDLYRKLSHIRHNDPSGKRYRSPFNNGPWVWQNPEVRAWYPEWSIDTIKTRPEWGRKVWMRKGSVGIRSWERIPRG